MKKLVVLSILLAIIVAIFCVFKFVFTTESLLINVMNSKKTFIDEGSNEILFKDYKIAGVETAKPEKYTFVDLDEDGKKELAVYTTADYGAYMIFRYNKANKKVYGYMIGVRSFQDLKVDGTFKGSGGADTTSYLEIAFNNNKKSITTQAIDDGMTENYEIDGKKVSEDEINKYVEIWNQKESCIWTKEKIENTKKEDDKNTTNNQEKNLVGIYYNTNWNGKEATLTLNEDGTCKYPTGTTDCKWSISENDVIITIMNTYEEKASMQVFLEDSITEAKISEIQNEIFKIEGTGSISWQENENAFDVTIINSTLSKDIYNKISSLDGIKSIIQNKENIKETSSEHKASIVNNGLILHDHFFQKMN